MRFETVGESEVLDPDSVSAIENTQNFDSTVDAVVSGVDDWLFAGDAIAAFHHKSDADEQLMEVWRDEITRREVRLSSKGIRYFHVCVPDKLTIQSDFLDRAQEPLYPVDSQFSPLQCISSSKAKPVGLIDSSGYLQRQLGKYPLFWKSDTRWTPWSAYMTSQLLCSALRVQINNQLLGYPFDESSQLMNLDEDRWPDNPEQIRTYRLWLRSKRRYANNLAQMREALLPSNEPLLSQSEFAEGSHVVFENHDSDAHNLSIVLFGNEHSADNRTLLTGMLAETFSVVHFVWADGIDYEYVDRVQPDVVITQGSELQLLQAPKSEIDMNELAIRSLERIEQFISNNGRLSETSVLRAGAKSKILLPAERYALDAPVLVQPFEEYAQAESSMISNEVVLHEISDAQVFFNGPALWVHDNRGREILRDNVPQSQRRRRLWLRGRRLQGTALLFATSAGAHCYYHWMLEILPKLGMLEREGIALDTINHFLVREISGQWQLETLARFGIDESRIVETVKEPHWRCDKMLHIDLNCGINLKMNRFIPQWMKHLFPLNEQNKPRIKLYISRPQGVRRGIANEHEFLPLLKAAGFTIMAMEGLTVAQQASLLARTDVLISPHGGALTNMVFCKPGITVVELFSRHVFPYYYGLAANCGHRYHAILEQPEQDYPRLVSSAAAQSFADSQHETSGLSFDVSVDAIKSILEIV